MQEPSIELSKVARTISPVRLFPVVALCTSALWLSACGGGKGGSPGQTAAKVNSEIVSVEQVEFVLNQQRGVPADRREAAARQIAERLVDQALAAQKAEALKLDRDPRVELALALGRREILARAFAEKAGEAALKPGAEEIKKYYADNPALFSQRRIYNLQEIALEASAEQMPALREKLAASKSTQEFVDHLSANAIRFAGNQAVRSAEQLPLATLKFFANLKDGQALINQTPKGAQVVVLAGSSEQPVSEEQARPAIEQFLLNERKRKLIDDERRALRAAAKIEYTEKFAPAEAAGATPAASAAQAEQAASGALDLGAPAK